MNMKKNKKKNLKVKTSIIVSLLSLSMVAGNVWAVTQDTSSIDAGTELTVITPSTEEIIVTESPVEATTARITTTATTTAEVTTTSAETTTITSTTSAETTTYDIYEVEIDVQETTAESNDEVVELEAEPEVVDESVADPLSSYYYCAEEWLEDAAPIEMTEEEMALYQAIVGVEAYSWWDYTGQKMIADVISNRVRSPYFPNTVWEVLTAPGQFETYSNGRYLNSNPTEVQVEACYDSMSGYCMSLPEDVLYFCTVEYYNTLPEGSWFKQLEVYTIWDNTIFFYV